MYEISLVCADVLCKFLFSETSDRSLKKNDQFKFHFDLSNTQIHFARALAVDTKIKESEAGFKEFQL